MKLSWLSMPFAVLLLSSGLSELEAAPEADTPGGSTAAAAESAIYAQPTNLTVLPKNIPPAQLKALMKRYGEELGVQCGHCHVEDPESHHADYASDDNPKKETARLMISMLSDINTRYLSQSGDARYAAHVTCGNCHQGQTDPPAFESTNRQ
jgi:hypothetical protein